MAQEYIGVTSDSRIKGINDYPVHILPDEIRNYVLDLKEVKGSDIGISSFYGLFALATAIGKNYKLSYTRYSPSFQTPVLKGVLIAKSGIGKSPISREMLLPINKFNKELMQKYKQEKELTEGNATHTPVRHYSIMRKATCEAVLQILSRGSQVLVFHDEMKAYLVKCNKNDTDDRKQFLESFNGDDLSSNTIGRGDDYAAEPYLSHIGNIQPKEASKVLSFEINDGFNERLLIQHVLNPKRKKLLTDRELSKLNQVPTINNSKQKYCDFIYKIISDSRHKEEAVEMVLNEECNEIYMNYIENNDDRKGQMVSGIDEAFDQLPSKLEAYTIRFALMLAVAEYYSKGLGHKLEVSKKNMQDAITLNEYYKNSWLYAMEEAKGLGENPLNGLPEKQAKLYLMLPDTFKTSDIQAVAEQQNLGSQATIKRFLTNEKLFTKSGRGQYRKIY